MLDTLKAVSTVPVVLPGNLAHALIVLIALTEGALKFVHVVVGRETSPPDAIVTRVVLFVLITTSMVEKQHVRLLVL